MKKLTSFRQVRTRNGVVYFIGKLSGIEVCLVPAGMRDDKGNPLWELIATTNHVAAPTHVAEVLDGGCLLVRLAEPKPPSTKSPRPPRKKVAGKVSVNARHTFAANPTAVAKQTRGRAHDN
jgi:hypothetical protein